jgi:hypothetical protein
MLTRRAIFASTVALTVPLNAVGKKRKKSKPTPKSKTSKLKPDTPLPLMHDLAMHHRHGWRDEGAPIPDLVARYRAGEILQCICGSISAVGVQVLRDAGLPARSVGVITKQPFNSSEDGHVMLEVWDQGAWRLYDLDGNRRAVDGAGRGINLVAQVAAGTNRIWEAIANDPRAATDGTPDPSPSDQAALDERVFGTPWIATPAGGGVFHDASDRARMEGKGHTYVSKQVWQRLLGKP